MNLRSALWAIIERHQLTVSHLTARASISNSQMSYWKQGKRDIKSLTMQKLIDALPDEAYQDFVDYLGKKNEIDSVEAAIALIETSELSDEQMARVLASTSKCLQHRAQETPEQPHASTKRSKKRSSQSSVLAA